MSEKINDKDDFRKYFTWKKLDEVDDDESPRATATPTPAPTVERVRRPRLTREPEASVEPPPKPEVARKVKPDWHNKVPPLPVDLLMSASSSFGLSEDDDERKALRQVTRKALKNPLVWLGTAATVSALVMMLVTTMRKDQKRLQFYMRARIASQAFTVISLAAGSWYLSLQQSADEGINEKQKSEMNEQLNLFLR